MKNGPFCLELVRIFTSLNFTKVFERPAILIGDTFLGISRVIRGYLKRTFQRYFTEKKCFKYFQMMKKAFKNTLKCFKIILKVLQSFHQSFQYTKEKKDSITKMKYGPFYETNVHFIHDFTIIGGHEIFIDYLAHYPVALKPKLKLILLV